MNMWPTPATPDLVLEWPPSAKAIDAIAADLMVNWTLLAAYMASVMRVYGKPRTDIRFVPDGRGGVILQGRLVT